MSGQTFLQFLIITLLLVSGAHVCMAQTSTSEDKFPNSLDLRAAYCLKIGQMNVQSIFQGKSDQEKNQLSPEDQKYYSEKQAKINRLTRYLDPRMVLALNEEGVAQIAGAAKQAEEDWHLSQKYGATGELSKNSDLRICAKRCQKKSPDDLDQKCMDKKCLDYMPEFLKHVRQCINIEAELPY